MKWSKLSPNEFYYHACDSEDGVTVLIVPAEFWNSNEFFLDEKLGIESLLPDFISEDMDSIFYSRVSIEETIQALNERGFSKSEDFSEFCDLAFSDGGNMLLELGSMI